MIKIKICLVNPPMDVPVAPEAGEVWPENEFCHLGLGYIAATLEAHGFSVDLFDCDEQRLTLFDVVEIMRARAYNAVGVSTYSYNLKNVIRLVVKVKKFAPAAFVFLGGYLPTLNYDLIFNAVKEVDCCVVGEGEETALELAGALQQGKDWRLTPGVVYREGREIKKTPPRAFITNLDELPFPKRSSPRGETVSLITGRGCYGKCNFCAAPRFYSSCPGKVLRFRTPQNVVAEIKWLLQAYNTRFFKFNDDNFIISSPRQKRWLWDFCRLIEEEGLKINFRAMIRPDELVKNRDILPELKKAGLEYLFIGVESFVQRQLDFYNKRIKVATNIKAVEILHALGLKIRLGFILLDPFVTGEEILENIKILKQTRFYELVVAEHVLISGMMPLTPIPGTDFYDLVKKGGLLKNNDISYDFIHEEAGFFYRVTRLWGKKAQAVNNTAGRLLSEAAREGDARRYEQLRRGKVELFRTDLDFMETLAELAQRKGVSLQEGVVLVNSWSQKLPKQGQKVPVSHHERRGAK